MGDMLVSIKRNNGNFSKDANFFLYCDAVYSFTLLSETQLFLLLLWDQRIASL